MRGLIDLRWDELNFGFCGQSVDVQKFWLFRILKNGKNDHSLVCVVVVVLRSLH